MDKPKDKERAETRACVDCQVPFEISAREITILKQQFPTRFKMPNRCPDCRRKIRENRRAPI